jgi:hypothetical protein
MPEHRTARIWTVIFSREVGLLATGLVVLIFLGCMSLSFGERSAEAPAPDCGPLVQKGEVTVPAGTEQDVYYPIPFASPPNLTIRDMIEECVVVDQKPDHFRIRNERKLGVSVCGHVAVQWTARGLRASANPAPASAALPVPATEPLRSETAASLPAGPVPVESKR